MWKYLILIVVVFFVFSCEGGFDSPEYLAKTAFRALKMGDFNEYKKCIPNVDDAKIFFERIKAETKLSEKELRKINKQLSKIDNEVKRIFKKGEGYFKRILDKAKREGIIWEETEFKHIKYEIEEEIRYGIKLKTADIHFFFIFKDSIYEIELDRCMQLNRGWLVSYKIRWRGISGGIGEGAQKFHQKKTIGYLKSLGSAVESYNIDNGFSPDVNSIKDLFKIKNFSPFYLKFPIIKDGWGNDFLYVSSPDRKTYSIGSAGRDKIFKGWNQKGDFAADDYDEDIIYSNGLFVKMPKIR